MHSYISFLEPQKDKPTFINFSERLYSYISLKTLLMNKLNTFVKKKAYYCLI